MITTVTGYKAINSKLCLMFKTEFTHKCKNYTVECIDGQMVTNADDFETEGLAEYYFNTIQRELDQLLEEGDDNEQYH